MHKKLLFFVITFFLFAKSYSQCSAPNSASATLVTSTSAKINWTTVGTNYTGHEILLIPSLTIPEVPSANPETTNGTLLFSTTTTTGNFTIPSGSLTSATRYYYYVRKLCTSSKSEWIGGISLTTTLCENVDKCNYNFILTNADGPTWNNASIQIKQNGMIVSGIGSSSINNAAGINIALCKNTPFEIYWSFAGTTPDKISLKVLDPYLETVYEKPAGTGTPETTLYNGFVTCLPPACQRPISLIAETITPNSAQLAWADINSPVAPSYDLYVTEFGAPAPQNGITSGAALISNVTSPHTLSAINGQSLTPSTRYTVYIRANCTASSQSSWIYSPMYFTTVLANDHCSTAYPVAVNAGQYCVASMTHGTTKGATQSLPTPLNNGGGCGTVDDDVWFSFTATHTSHAISFKNMVALPATTTLNHSVFTGECSDLTNLYCSAGNLSLATNLTIGQVYYLRVYTSGSNLANFVEFDICITSPPSNDDCDTALTIPVSPTREVIQSVSGNTLCANASLPAQASGPGCGTTDDDVWFSFTALSTTQIITIADRGNSAVTLYHSIYSGTNCDLTLLYCSNQMSSIATGLTIGNQYNVRVYTAATTTILHTSFKISVTTPPVITNDECSNALPLTLNAVGSLSPIATTGSLTGATGSPQVPTCPGFEDDDVWYSFTANAQVVLSQLQRTIGTGELNFALYSATDCNSLTPITCKTSGMNLLNVTVGQLYFIRIWTNLATISDAEFEIMLTNVATPLVVSNTLTASQLVSNVLMDSPCVTISNVTSSTGTDFGSVNGIGYFSAASDSNFPISSGIVLSTGDINKVPGPNTNISSTGIDAWLGDTDLNTIILPATGSAMNSKNASKLEFDFTTIYESMSFNFLFASEEYGQFQCEFSDTFAFLLTNLTTNVTTNLAVVPNTSDPISTVTIRNTANNSQCASVHPEFFDAFYDDDDVAPYTTATNFNGITQLMTASSTVVPGTPYHIKLVVADRLDTQYDSAVFLQAGSFASGPPECTDKIKLVSFIDSNENGVKDSNESSFTYGSFTYHLNDSEDINYIASPIGNYTIYDTNPANLYDFNFVVNAEYQPYFTAAVTNFNNLNIATGSGTTTLYFPVNLIQGYNDVTVSIVPVSPPVAGMTFKNKIVYKNLGVTSASGTINFTKDPASTIVSTSIITTSIPGGFTYTFTNLAPFETRSIDVLMSIPPIPTVNIDDVLTSDVTISAPANDININNNAFANTQIVVASYDPNDKMEAHGEKIKFSIFNQNDYLTYTIRFQNTGTSNAINIRLEDLLDAQLDETSIRMIDASHNYVMNRVDNKITWYFDYIQLPGMIVNEALSHGYVTFSIKLKPGFAIGDIVPNQADIYFDTNPPILTNTFLTEFVTQLGTPSFDSSNVVVYPNPGNGNIQISASQTNETFKSIVLYDVLGKCVKKKPAVGATQTSINVSDLSQGIYMMEITTESDIKITKKLIVN